MTERAFRLRCAGFFRWTTVLAGATGCMDDLPAPLDCPPAAAREAKACGLGDSPLCFEPEEVSCLASKFECGDQCSQLAGCYPDGDCPRYVTEMPELADARCARVDDVGPGTWGTSCPPCRDWSCLSVCDGVGTIVGMRPGTSNADFQVKASTLTLGRRVGLYLRVRGAGLLAVSVADSGTPLWGDSVGPLGPELAEYRLFSSGDDHLATGDVVFRIGPKGSALAEIDCAVPFAY